MATELTDSTPVQTCDIMCGDYLVNVECQVSHLCPGSVEEQVKGGCKCLQCWMWEGIIVSATSQVHKGTGRLNIWSVRLSDNGCTGMDISAHSRTLKCTLIYCGSTPKITYPCQIWALGSHSLGPWKAGPLHTCRRKQTKKKPTTNPPNKLTKENTPPWHFFFSCLLISHTFLSPKICFQKVTEPELIFFYLFFSLQCFVIFLSSFKCWNHF